MPAPPLDRFGLPNVDGIVGMSMSYQIARKIHAATDPHDPPEYVNNRPRYVVDLVLLNSVEAFCVVVSLNLKRLEKTIPWAALKVPSRAHFKALHVPRCQNYFK